MPIEIKVTPPGITISQGRTFMVTDQRGEINPQSDEGIYAIDTRFISSYHLYINRQPWILVNSGQLSFYASRIYLTNPAFSTPQADIDAHTIGLMLERTVGNGIHEDFYITNYTGKQIEFVLELALDSDFADLFEVKSNRLIKRGRMRTRWGDHERKLRTSYTDKDFHRAVTYHVFNTDVPVGFANGRIFYEIQLESGQEWHTCGELILDDGQHVRKSVYGHRPSGALSDPSTGTTSSAEAEPSVDFDERQARWQARCTDVLTPNEHVYRMYRQAVEDMGA